MNTNNKKRTFQKDLRRYSITKLLTIITLFMICIPLALIFFVPPIITRQEATFDSYISSPNYYIREINWDQDYLYPYIDIWIEFEAQDDIIVYIFNSNQFDKFLDAKDQGYIISNLDCVESAINSKNGILNTNSNKHINPIYIILDSNGSNLWVSVSYKITLSNRDPYLIFYIISLVFIISSIAIYLTLKNPNCLLSNSSVNKEILEALDRKSFFKTDEEKNLFEENINSLRYFEYIENYKYCLISMGSILEFLIIRYCKMNNLVPVNKNGNSVNAKDAKFYNYIQTLINNNTLNQRHGWKYVQDHIRDFRNYVHIEKEINENKISKMWYINAKQIYDEILNEFIS